MRILLHYTSISLAYITYQSVINKTSYGPRRFLQSNISGIDISTCRLWYAMLMTKSCEYRLSLRTMNTLLSSISPYTLYFTGIGLFHVSDATKERYVDMFTRNNTRVIERARRAWVFDLQIMPLHMDMIPAALQEELMHCDQNVGME